MALSLNNQTYTIERLLTGSADLNVAADLLADAFMFGNPDPADSNSKGLPDPFYNRPNRGDQKVRELFHRIISLVSEIGHTIAVVREGENQIVGVSWIKGRRVRDMNYLDFFKLIGPIYRAFGLLGSIRYGLDIINYIPSYADSTTYISMLGVAKSSQGKGIGKALVQHAVDSADGQDIALCNMNPRNIEIYQRFGFELLPEKQTQCGDSLGRPGFTTYHMAYRKSTIETTPSHVPVNDRGTE